MLHKCQTCCNLQRRSQQNILRRKGNMFAITLLLGIASTTGFSFGSRIGATVNVHGETTALKMSVALAPLPYDTKALEPIIGEQTLLIHHGKHHAKYVATTNAMIAGTSYEDADVVTILRGAYGNNQGLFNNAAQSWNHEFYWKCMKPNGGGVATGKIAAMIDAQFGSYDKFKAEFATAGNTAFGSGWAWLVYTPSGLKVTKTIGADNPLTEGESIPLLTMDVWEHAYYLDEQNMRGTYIDNFLAKLVNWDFVNSNLPADA